MCGKKGVLETVGRTKCRERESMCVEQKEKGRIVAIRSRVGSQCLCSGLVVSHSGSNQRGWGEEHSVTLQSYVNKTGAEGRKRLLLFFFPTRAVYITQVNIIEISLFNLNKPPHPKKTNSFYSGTSLKTSGSN